MSPIFLRILQLIVLVIIQGVLLFVSAGSLRWPAGWWYIGLYVFMLLLASFLMIPNRREVVEERSRGAKGGKTWDRWLTQLMIVPSLGLLVLTGLDQRWNWTQPLPLWLRLSGVVIFILGYALVLGRLLRAVFTLPSYNYEAGAPFTVNHVSWVDFETGGYFLPFLPGPHSGVRYIEPAPASDWSPDALAGQGIR